MLCAPASKHLGIWDQVMATNQANCKAMEELHNKEIETWQGVLQGKNVELTEATGALNAKNRQLIERSAFCGARKNVRFS